MNDISLLIKKLDTQTTWSTSRIKELITSIVGISTSGERVKLNTIFGTIDIVQVGDVFLFPIVGVHPALVIKLDGTHSYAAILSSQEDNDRNVYPLKNDRFLKDSYVTGTIVRVPNDEIKPKYIGSLGNLKEIRLIKNALRKNAKDILIDKAVKPTLWKPVIWNPEEVGELD